MISTDHSFAGQVAQHGRLVARAGADFETLSSGEWQARSSCARACPRSDGDAEADVEKVIHIGLLTILCRTNSSRGVMRKARFSAVVHKSLKARSC